MTWNQIYLTAQGSYKSSSPWFGESAQIGIRMTVESSVSPPALGSVYEPLQHESLEAAGTTATGAHGSIVSLWTATAGVLPEAEEIDAAVQVDLCEDFWTFLNAVKAYTSTGFNWTSCKIAPILVDGKYGAPSSVYTFTSPLAGTGTESGQLPPENALAVSLRAPILGRRGRGRMFLPAMAGAITTAGVVGATPRNTIKTALVTFVTDLNNLPGIDWPYRPSVCVSSAGAATAVRPSEVRIGSFMDVQRRRGDQVVESYETAAL